MRYILLVCLMCLVSCLNHNIPIANLEFKGFEKRDDGINSFFLYFSSDIELKERLNKDHIGGRFNCFFLDKKIDKEDFVNYKGYSLASLGDLELVSKTSTYNYKTRTLFELTGVDTVPGNVAVRYKNALDGAIKQLNRQPDCISCVVNAVTYFKFTKGYISNTMCVPKKDLLEIMK